MATLTLIKKPSASGAKKYFQAKNSFTTGPIEVWRMIEGNHDIGLVDVREIHDFQQGHIPGAINLPRDQWQKTEALYKDKPNVVYCYSQTCHLASKACEEFASKGFPVMEMEGGFQMWQQYNLKVRA